MIHLLVLFLFICWVPHELQHTRLFCPTLSPKVCSNSCPLSWWCYLTNSSSVIPFSSNLQSFPASGSFPMSQFFTLDGQTTGVSASASVFPVNTQDWFPLGMTGWISLQFKGLSRVFSNTTLQKHQFFSAMLSSQSNLMVYDPFYIFLFSNILFFKRTLTSTFMRQIGAQTNENNAETKIYM